MRGIANSYAFKHSFGSSSIHFTHRTLVLMITRIKKHMILCRIGELCGIFSVLKKLIWWEFFIGLAIKISIVCNLIEWNILFYLVFESHRSLFIKRGLSLYITFFERILDDINGLKTNSFPKMESRVFWNNVHKM